MIYIEKYVLSEMRVEFFVLADKDLLDFELEFSLLLLKAFSDILEG